MERIAVARVVSVALGAVAAVNAAAVFLSARVSGGCAVFFRSESSQQPNTDSCLPISQGWDLQLFAAGTRVLSS